MKNEYGTPLDRNGYAPSIMQRDQFCYWCCKSGPLQRHEIFGSAYRDKSKALGLWVYLCPECHHMVHFVHANMKLLLRQRGQVTAQSHYGWSDQEFRDHFGKVYR